MRAAPKPAAQPVAVAAARAAAKPAAQPVAQPVPKPAVQPMAQDHSKLLSLHVYAVAVGASTVWYRSSARWSTLCPSRLGGTVASVVSGDDPLTGGAHVWNFLGR